MFRKMLVCRDLSPASDLLIQCAQMKAYCFLLRATIWLRGTGKKIEVSHSGVAASQLVL